MIDRQIVDDTLNQMLRQRIGQLEIDAISGQAHMQVMQAHIEELTKHNTFLEEKLKHLQGEGPPPKPPAAKRPAPPTARARLDAAARANGAAPGV